MKKVDGVNYLSIGELAKRLGRTVVTIKSWIDWYAEQPEEIQREFPLPEFRRDLDKRGTRFVAENRFMQFYRFKNAMVYGKMALSAKQKKLLRG